MLYLLRHGTTVLNKNGVTQSNSDQGLIIEGEHQIYLAAEQMMSWGANIKVIVSSPSKRALDSAAILHSSFPKADVQVQQCLQERSLGDFEGLQRNDLIAERLRRGISGENPWQDWDNTVDVESDHSIFQRISPLLATPNSVIPFAEDDVAWVTHSGVIKSFIRFACGCDGGYSRLYIGCGGIVRIWQDAKNGNMTIDQIYNTI